MKAIVLLLAIALGGSLSASTVERWGLFEMNLPGPASSNPYVEVRVSATFSQGGQRRVSLFVFTAPDLTVPGGRRINDRDVLLANQHGYNVALWKDREIAYSLVSDLDEQDVLELVAASGH